MKKSIAIIMALLLLAAGIVSCGARDGDDGRLKVVCTIFPEYDWVKNITEGADGIDVTLLIDNGVDLHNYQPTVRDMAKISTCDVFIYAGGGSDKWVGDALAGAENREMTVISLLDLLGDRALEEEITEGMEEDADEEDDGFYDEHVWLSLKNSAYLCRVITEKLCEKDAGNAGKYRENCSSYVDEINALDERYESAVKAADSKYILVADRFPFLYMTRDYGIEYSAAFAGCSAETEASFETIAFLADKIAEKSLRCVIVTESSDRRIAETVISESGVSDCRILVMNSGQAVTRAEISAGTTYISLMTSNLETLESALG